MTSTPNKAGATADIGKRDVAVAQAAGAVTKRGGAKRSARPENKESTETVVEAAEPPAASQDEKGRGTRKGRKNSADPPKVYNFSLSPTFCNCFGTTEGVQRTLATSFIQMMTFDINYDELTTY